MKTKLRESKEELKRVTKLLNIAKPANLPTNLGGNKKPEIKQEPPKTLSELSIASSATTPTDGSKIQIKFNLNKPPSKTIANNLQESELKAFSNQDDTSSPKLSTPKLKVSPAENKAKSKPVPKTPSFEPTPEDIEEDSDSSGDDDNNKGDSNDTSPKKTKRRIRQKVKKELTYDYDESDPKYSTWVAPKNQTGDGRTSLNDKLGY